jgi:hypothetical protein
MRSVNELRADFLNYIRLLAASARAVAILEAKK